MNKKTTMNGKIMGLLLVVGTSVALAGCTSGNASAKTAPAEAATNEAQTTTPAQPDTQPAQPDTQIAQTAQSSQQTSQPAAGAAVDDQQALSLAISAAGAAQADVSFSQVKLDFDDDYGKQIYEVEFHVGSTEYSYDIDPGTGAILSSDIDVDD